MTEREREVERSRELAAAARRRLEPQPGIDPPAGQLRRGTLPPGADARLWWLGVHGGAGESTLARLVAHSRAAGHVWPLGRPDEPQSPPPAVVLVARTHANGLRAAQAAATEWASRTISVSLLGLALIADAPGRPPKPLRDLAQLVEGGVPAVWRVPWHEPWRLGEAVERSSAPRAVESLIEAIENLAPVRSGAVLEDQKAGARSRPPEKGVARA